MLYETRFSVSLLVTLAIECPIVACFVKFLFKEGSAKAPPVALSKNFDPHVRVSTLRSKFFCRLASGAFAEPSGKDKKLKLFYVIFVSAIASIITLPYFWFVLPPYIDARHYIIIGEFSVFLVEILIYMIFLKVNIQKAFLLSFSANLASYLLGSYVVRWILF